MLRTVFLFSRLRALTRWSCELSKNVRNVYYNISIFILGNTNKMYRYNNNIRNGFFILIFARRDHCLCTKRIIPIFRCSSLHSCNTIIITLGFRTSCDSFQQNNKEYNTMMEDHISRWRASFIYISDVAFRVSCTRQFRWNSYFAFFNDSYF